MDINVIGVAPIPGRRFVRLKDSESHRLALNIRIVPHAEPYFEAQNFGEEGQGVFNVLNMHKRRYVNEVRHTQNSRRQLSRAVSLHLA